MTRIGVTQRVEVVPSYGERRDCLDQAWTQLLARCGMVPVPLCNTVKDVEGYLRELDLGGVVLSGGNDLAHLGEGKRTAPERDAFERRLLASEAGRGLPILGVCRGLQIMVTADGGELVPVLGHVATSHALLAAPTSPAWLRDRDTVNSYHSYGVQPDDLGPSWETVAKAPDGTVEAVVHRRLRRWAVMWHPERAPSDEQDVVLLRELFGQGEP